MLAFDLGGTRCKAGVVAAGRVAATAVADVAGMDADAALGAVLRLAGELGSGPWEAVGLAVPGLSDGRRVVALPGKFPGIEGRDLRADLADLTTGEVVVVNDAIAYGIGEAVHGAGQGLDRVVVVTIGTGVGTAVIEHGRPLGDGHLGGGLIGGQLLVGDPVGPLDTNGRSGTIEARCRAERIVAEARDAGAEVRSVPEVFAAAAAGDASARAGLAAYRTWLVRALVALVHAHAPDAVVVGGGPLPDGGPLLDGVEAAVRRDVWPGLHPAVRRAVAGDHAALLGLATLAAS